MYFLEDSYYGYKKENDCVSRKKPDKMTVSRIPIRKRYTLMLNQIQTPKPSSDLGLLPSWEVQGAGSAWDQLSLGWFWDTPAKKEEARINSPWRLSAGLSWLWELCLSQKSRHGLGGPVTAQVKVKYMER